MHGIDDAEADLLEQVSTLASSASVLCARYKELVTPAAATDGNSTSDVLNYALKELKDFSPEWVPVRQCELADMQKSSLRSYYCWYRRGCVCMRHCWLWQIHNV